MFTATTAPCKINRSCDNHDKSYIPTEWTCHFPFNISPAQTTRTKAMITSQNAWFFVFLITQVTHEWVPSCNI